MKSRTITTQEKKKSKKVGRQFLKMLIRFWIFGKADQAKNKIKQKEKTEWKNGYYVRENNYQKAKRYHE